MAGPQHVQIDGTETIYSYPPILAQPSAATVRVRTGAQPLQAVGDSATVDSISVATTAAAVRGDTLLTVASAAWVSGVQYLAVATDGGVFVLVASETETGTTLNLAEPLPRDLPSGSTIKGYRVSHALTSAETTEEGEGLAIWTATIASVPYTWTQQFRVVRRRVAYTLTSTRLTQLSPKCRRLQSSGDRDFTEAIDAAWTRWVEPSFKSKGIRAEQIVSWAEVEPAHVAAVELFLVFDSQTDTEMRQEALAAWNLARDLALASPDWWQASGDDEDLAPQTTDAPNVVSHGFSR